MSSTTVTDQLIDKRPRSLRRPGTIVDERVNRIQEAFVRADAPWARATLAYLRGAIRREPGSVPEIWEWTQCYTREDAPDSPTYEEWAVHLAMCLYATHQQGKGEAVHRPGYGFGRAVRMLAGNDADIDSPVRRRFAKVLTADTLGEVSHHLRGLITQLRSASALIPLDYGMLADDLFSIQFPDGRNKVRLRWSRQYYGVHNSPDSTSEKESK